MAKNEVCRTCHKPRTAAFIWFKGYCFCSQECLRQWKLLQKKKRAEIEEKAKQTPLDWFNNGGWGNGQDE